MMITIAFYGFRKTGQQFNQLHRSLLEFFHKLNCPADLLAIPGFGKWLLFKKALSKLKNHGIEVNSSFAISSLVPNLHEALPEYHSRLFSRLRLSEDDDNYFFVTAHESVAQLDSDELLNLANFIVELVEPNYGIGFCRGQEDYPHEYVSGSEIMIDPEQGRMLGLTDWAKFGRQPWVQENGLLRDVYRLNFLRTPHLNRKIEGQTLEEWIASNKSRGELCLLVAGMKLWKVDEWNLAGIRQAMWDANAIFNCPKNIPPPPPLRPEQIPPWERTPEQEEAVQQLVQEEKREQERAMKNISSSICKRTKKTQALRDALIRKIDAQLEGRRGADWEPVVGLEEYFEGNWDEYSFATNQADSGRAPLVDCYRILREIRSRPEVQDVLVSIHTGDCPAVDDDTLIGGPQPIENDPDVHIWPPSGIVYVLTSATPKELAEWTEELAVDEVGKGWGEKKPPAAPTPRKGMKVLTLWWD